MIGLKLVDPIAKIEKDIRSALVKDLNIFLNSKKDTILNKIRNSSKSWILSQPELSSLEGSSVPYSLNSLFGLLPSSGPQAIDAIVNSIVNSIRVEFSKINNDFKGGITLSIQPLDFQNLLGLPEGHVITEKGTDLHWLDWLLTKGDTVIVAGYQYDAQGSGRSGVGRMVGGSAFRVPPSFSGVTSNNFVTRAFRDKQEQVQKIISEVLR